MNKTLIVVAGSVVALTSSLAVPDELAWDNYPNGTDGSYISSQLCWGYFDSQCADDFKFSTDTAISSVQWNGGYWPNEPGFPADWNILFYADAGGMPPGGPYDPTDYALVKYFKFWDSVVRHQEWDGSWTVTASISPPFIAEAGQRYWIAIQADLFYPPQWGISNSDTLQEIEAHTGFPMFETYYWTPTSYTFGWAMDMAFRLYAAACPADVNDDDVVDIDDLFQVLAAWGPCDECAEDINDDGVVDIDDVFEVLANWGPCP